MTLDPQAIARKVSWAAHTKRIADILVPVYGDSIGLGYSLANTLLPVEVAFDRTNPHVKSTIKELGKRITAISDTSRERMVNTIGRALEGERNAIHGLSYRGRSPGKGLSRFRSYVGFSNLLTIRTHV